MKHKYFIYTLVPTLGLVGMLVAQGASARGPMGLSSLGRFGGTAV